MGKPTNLEGQAPGVKAANCPVLRREIQLIREFTVAESAGRWPEFVDDKRGHAWRATTTLREFGIELPRRRERALRTAGIFHSSDVA